MEKDLNYWIELSNSRANASRFAQLDSEDRKQVEQDVAKMFAHSLKKKFGVHITHVHTNPIDPPDTIARLNNSLIGIEATELVDGDFLARAKHETKKGEALTPCTGDGFSLTQWTQDRFQKHLNNLIQKKVKKYSDRKIDVLLIYSGEFWLNEQNTEKFVEATRIELPCCFNAIYLILDYEPSCEHQYPLFQICGNLN